MPAIAAPPPPDVEPAAPGAGPQATGAEQARLANFFFRSVLEQVSEGTLILSADANAPQGPRVMFQNTPMAVMAGVDPVNGLRDRPITQLTSSPDEASELLEAVRTAAQRDSAEWIGGLKTGFSGKVRRCRWRVRAVRNNHGVLLNFTVIVSPHEVEAPAVTVAPQTPAGGTDATRRLRNENLAFAARGMAHDVNNILGIIGVRVSEAMLMLPHGHEARGVMEEALSAVRRGQGLTSGVLHLAKDMPAKIEPVDMLQLIRETAAVVRGGTAVSIDIHGEPRLHAALADAGRIGQVLQNLIINGIQSMEKAGRMEIIARNTVLSHGDPKLAPGRYVEIIVRDRGCGMTPDVLAKLFKESVTTKENGNGVGLTTCQRIIEDHGGDIRVSSLMGTGTEFTFFLPATQLSPAAKKASPGQSLVMGQGTILLVDDEPELLMATVAVLKRCGYHVYAAQSGEQGVVYYQQLARANNPADVVIMDLTLAGGLSGEEAMHEMRAFDPRAKIIASSGDLLDQMRMELLSKGFAEVLPKPYVASTLSEIVHSVLAMGRRTLSGRAA
jgi:signal transduction histidine kinase/CheY-like chemotaxis protein